ncbi:MAG: 50S ribosomal protein L13 [Bacteroidetes bacterium]|nr:50S ribosomal protein L13 [Bacteroidota bacterium]MCA0446697.1 50S ribosomal protein L13 [Bacteroidota bacterium]
MDHNSFKTFSAKPFEVEAKWWVIDASGLVVGRLATEVARLVRGKHKPQFTPHTDTGDFVIVINAEKVILTGNKENVKEYFHYSGYPGGDKFKKFKDVKLTNPEFIIENAVKGMLPKNTLGRQQLKKVKVFKGSVHNHQAQTPEPYVIQ